MRSTGKKRHIEILKEEINKGMIDENVLPYVIEFMKFNDIATSQSCSGHSGNRRTEGYIHLQCTANRANELWSAIKDTYMELFKEQHPRINAEVIIRFNGRVFYKHFIIHTSLQDRGLYYTTLINKLEERGFSKGEGIGEVECVGPSVFDIMEGDERRYIGWEKKKK